MELPIIQSTRHMEVRVRCIIYLYTIGGEAADRPRCGARPRGIENLQPTQLKIRTTVICSLFYNCLS